jgi:uncharacterized membrane protein YdcZ (DUF606 family)
MRARGHSSIPQKAGGYYRSKMRTAASCSSSWLKKLVYEILIWLFAFAAGALITCQVGSNSQLKKSLWQPLPALLANYVVGIAAVFLYTSIKQVPIPSGAKAFQTPWWGWLGGTLWRSLRTGSDHFCQPIRCGDVNGTRRNGPTHMLRDPRSLRVVSFDVHPASWARVGGCALMVFGLILIAKF